MADKSESNINKPTIMAVGAHHDDNELMGGTFLKFVQAGWRVVSVVMTNGVYIQGKVSPQHTAIREKESCDAAALLGIEHAFLRIQEGSLIDTESARMALLETLRTYRPKLVITHPPEDYHLDHMTANRITLAAVHWSWNPCVNCTLPVIPMPKLYYSDAWFVPFTADEYVDISDVVERKLEALSCHKSQLSTIGRATGDMVDLARHISRTRGVEAGVEYAEAFRLAPTTGSVRLRPLLGQ
jgi:LmbE family N-acetylglucosaminyl deacetylase